MIIVKYFILFIIFSGVSIVGNLVSKKYKNRVNELKDFKEFCNILESKIKFTYEPLGEIFEEISDLICEKNNVSLLIKKTASKLKEQDFKSAWIDEIELQKSNFNLKTEDINVIKGLGNMLGKTDMQGQLSEISLTSEFLDTQIQEAEYECKKNEKMYRSLGTIVGLAIVIILI